MKKLLSMLLSFTLLLSCVPFASAENAERVEGSAEIEAEGLEEELSAQLFGGGSDFQISAVEAESPEEILVTYVAAEDCSLVLTVTDDPGGTELAAVETPVSADASQAAVSVGLTEFPEYYRVTAALYRGNTAVSEEFTCYDHTLEYAQFLAMTPDDEAFAGQTVLDLGAGSDGRSNFAVVREDVHVIRVSSLEEVCPDAALMDVDAAPEYILPADGEPVESGDKILILPAGDPGAAIPLIVEDVDYRASLLEDSDSSETVAVATADVDASTAMEDFYTYVRMNVDFSADAGDLDTATADPIIEFDESAQLFGDWGNNVEKSTSFSIPEQNYNGVRINDTLTLSMNGRLEVSYGFFSLKKFTISTTLTATNVFTIQANYGTSFPDRSVRVGAIPVTGVPGLSLNIPVDIVFRTSFSAKFKFTATQTASTTINAGYDSGRCYCTASSSASSGQTLETEARATASLGIKAGLELTVLGFLKADVSGEVGVLAEVIAQSVNDTATYKHDCIACMDVSLYVYAQPSFSIQIRDKLIGPYKRLAGSTGSRIQSKFLGFYLSYRGGNNWSSGYGSCPNKRYLVTITVLDGATSKPLSDVEVERLGKTGSNGKVSGFLSSGKYYNLSLKRGGYEDSSVGVYVGSSPVSEKASLYLKTNNEDVTYTMEDWSSYPDDVLKNLIEKYREEGILVTLADAKDLDLLAIYTISGKPTADIKFYMNTTEEEIDLSAVEWAPIGNANHPFMGEFNGAGLIFSGLTGSSGFFGAVGDNAWVHDLTLSSVSLTGGQTIGAVANIAKSGAEISDIAVSGTISGKCAGGIVGQMEDAAIRNSYVNRLTVTGTECAGGLAGVYSSSTDKGALANCYTAAQTNGGTAGVLCGKVESSQTAQDAGLSYVYYLDSAASPAFGEIDTGLQPLAFSVNEAQAKGLDSNQAISKLEAPTYADATTLLEALNLWYADFGAYAKPDAEPNQGVQGIPDADAQDRYNHWYADGKDAAGSFSNDGYPIFAKRATVYPLTVHYSYEDGREAYPTVVLYYEEGARYDIDSYKIDGYYTNDVEYTGLMPGYPLDFFVVYYQETDYADAAKGLSAGHAAEAGKIYSVGDAEDLTALAQYIQAGGNTEAVAFEQTASIAVTGSWTGIGTAANPFRGSYEGFGFAVTGLDGALFTYTDGAEIQDVSLTADINTRADAGILAVHAKDSVLKNCTVSGKLVSSGYAGGLAAQLDHSRAERCHVNAEIQGGTGAGGLAMTSDGGTLRNCSFTGSIQANSGNAGGLTGTANGGTLANSFVYARVSGGSHTGGICGASQNLTLRNVFFAGTVSGAGQFDAITPAPFGGAYTNVFYQEGLTSAAADAQAFPVSGAAQLADRLNAWVQQQNSAQYDIWAVGQPSAELMEAENNVQLPVHSLPYENWLLDLTVENGVVSCTFDAEHYGMFGAMIALYDENGRLLVYKELPEGKTSFTVDDKNCAYARAFLCDETMRPLETAVRTASK